MPLYEYRCTACDRLTEKRQKFSDPEITECPYCGGKLERTITAPAVQFKGGGWYADGYGSKRPASASAEGSGAAAGEGKSAEGKTGEVKPTESKAQTEQPKSAPATPAANVTATPSAAPAVSTASSKD